MNAFMITNRFEILIRLEYTMELKLKKYIPLLLLFVIILLNDTHYLYFSQANHLYQLIIAVIMLFWTLIVCKEGVRKINSQMPFVRRICLITLISFFCVYMYSLMRYNDQTLMRTLIGDSGHYKTLLIILMYPLAYICYSTGGTRVLFKTLNIFAAINYIVTTVQYVLYNVNSVIFLPGYFVNGANPLLNGTLKMNLPWLGNLMILYNFYMFDSFKYNNIKASRRKKTLHFLLFILGLFDCILVSRVRVVIIAVSGCLVLLILMNRNTSRGLVKKIVLVCLLLIGIFTTDTVINFINSFSLNATRAYSTISRLYAIEYYWKYFVDHPFFGFGFADYISHYGIIHGDGRAAVSDVGIFGQLAKYGLFIIPIYIFPLWRSFYIMKKIWHNPYIKNQLFYLGMYAYIIVTSITLIAIDQFRFLTWPFFLTVMEVIYWASTHEQPIEEL